MNSYKSVLIIHAADKSTLFLSKFKEVFNDYFAFYSDAKSISEAKILIGDLEAGSLIVYLGHGDSSGLYEPDETHNYKTYFLDVTWGNHFFEDHDLIILSCKSNEYLKKIFKSNFSIGFGNIISSKEELSIHNKKSKIRKNLSEQEISIFNEIYVKGTIEVIKSMINKNKNIQDVPKALRFHINKKINEILLDKKNQNRVELTRILFEFRNQIILKYNPR